MIGGLLPPHPSFDDPPTTGSPRLARLGTWRFAGLGAGPQGGGRASAQHSGQCRASAGPWRARVREGLGGRAGPPKPGGQRGRPRASGLRDEHLATRRDPGRGYGAARAPRRASVAFVASSAAAADAPAQAPAPGTRRRPMLQAERALRAAARSRRAAALRRRKRDATGWCPRGPPGIREQGRPPLEGAVELIHEKAVTVMWPHAPWRSQAPSPRVAAVRR